MIEAEFELTDEQAAEEFFAQNDLDFDGSHTLESARHAAEFTGGQPYIVVSQQFHNERFIYMARQQGIDVWGLNCGNFMHSNILQLRQRCREALSRVKAVMFD